MKNLSKITEIEIYANNELNRITYDILNDLIPTLESYKGKKIYTADGKITAKTPLEITPPADGKIGSSNYKGDLYRSTTAYINNSGSSLWLNISLCFNGGNYDKNTSFAKYFKKEIYLGTMKTQILNEVKTLEYTAEIYNLGEILNIEKVNKKIEEFNDLINKAVQKQNEIPHYLRK
jgi:hypothetical protein